MSIARKLSRKKRCLCYTCGQEIVLDSAIRSENGIRIPHNPDGTKHDCPNSPYNIRKRQRQNALAASA